MNKIDLTGRRAVVTGAARGVGLAIAERLLASGAAVELWDIDEHALDAATKRLAGRGECYGTLVDVTDLRAINVAVQATVGHIGGIDILVNNAGAFGPRQKVWEVPVEEWRRTLDIDLNGVFLSCRAVIPMMLSAGYGRIVNISALAGLDGMAGLAAFSAAKAGVIALTKALAKELAGGGVLVNCVTPGGVETDAYKQQNTEEQIKALIASIPLGRLAKTEEIAALAAWLCSEECSFSTGSVFDISGGIGN